MPPKRATKTPKSAGLAVTREGKVRNPETGFGGSRGTSFEGDWLKLAQAVGGVNELAKLLGVSYPTLYRWAVKGGAVPGPARIVLGMIAASKNMRNPAVE